MLFWINHTFFCKSTWFSLLSRQKLMIIECSNLGQSVWFSAILRRFQTNIFTWRILFLLKTNIINNAGITFTKINLKTNLFYFSKIKIPLCIEWISLSLSQTHTQTHTPTQIYTHIIILSCHQHGYPWPSLATSPNHSSLLAGPQGYILYWHRASVWRFELVPLLLFSYMRGSIVEHELVSASPAVKCMSGSSNFDSFRDGW